MKLNIILSIIQSLLPLSLAATLRESASHVKDIYLPDPSVTYYNDTEGYPNQDFVKHINTNHIDPNTPDYLEQIYDFRKIATDFINYSFPELEISDYSSITYGENSILVGYHNKQTINSIPVLNSDITITINAETGLIINKSFLTINNVSDVETSDILNADDITKKINLIEAINIITKEYELFEDEFNYNDVIFTQDPIEKGIIIKNVPFTTDKKIIAKMGIMVQKKKMKKQN
ncbi:hypothetical protein BCR36DRAFT_416683 [Piromyces finnis]|uniref:FTP domain-containing protein n=1 Tax=Piromyces finnis TaxID=1754191 RepID=A0A1Y1UU62_9FUNG|nr:hypothetical protein BCR36DRAFT_416683 [Piromyces finnis]|eukprot:ORX41552.1 hypothetical protein BCR36DRAFT_416683 [Piromyces finnis]